MALSLTPAPRLAPNPSQLSDEEAQTIVRHALSNEIAASSDFTHPMQYRIRKQSPRLATTKQIIETKEGDVALLIATNDEPLSASDQQLEQARLHALLSDPSRQRHRQEREQGDAERARKILRALPDAFVYQYVGIIETSHGPSYRMSFEPRPGFDPPDIEAQALKAMAGEMWIDVAQQRVTRLQGKRLHDVEYGWGLIGKLQQGGTLLLEQADVGDHQWRTVHMTLTMNARILFKTIKLDTTLALSDFTPVSTNIGYRDAIKLLEVGLKPPSTESRLSPSPPFAAIHLDLASAQVPVGKRKRQMRAAAASPALLACVQISFRRFRFIEIKL